MRLTELLSGLTAVPAGDVDIAGLTADSREVKPGYIFAALAGAKDDGARYASDALARGAAALIVSPSVNVNAPATIVIRDPAPRRLLAQLAARFYGAQPRTIAAVTGTSGKTSVANFTRQIWDRLGRQGASLGTLGVNATGYNAKLDHTTPDPVRLHQELAALARHGVTHLALEASSHGLDQDRLAGVNIAAGAFTNLSRDHFDYHGDEESYFAAKMRLFSEAMPRGRVAVLNADADRHAQVLAVAAGHDHRVLDYGVKARVMRVDRLVPTVDGLDLEAELFGARHRIDLKLMGGFQAGNALCALGLAVGCGEEAEAAIATMSALEGVPGRMQKVADAACGAPIFVDYSHKPDALATVLRALRPHVSGRLGLVFGCGGDRDRGKRPIMGRIARDLADLVWVTDDNPRTEPAAAIRAEVMVGCPDAIEIGDRAEAIHVAVSSLEPGDALLIAGKGHEQGQIVGATVRPFDDASVARAAARGGE